MVTRTCDGFLFAKNSDRDPNEAQFLDWRPSSSHAPGSDVQCTWIQLPQVPRTRAVLLSRPWWMWGAEMGANDAGVVIGNEAVFTHSHEDRPGLVGMDLLRLALERAGSAEEAVHTIVSLLERHGQGGSCSFEQRGFSYDNSFLVVDPEVALVVETAGRAWATETVTQGARSISNGLTIAGFAGAHGDRLRSSVAAAARRRTITTSGAAAAGSVADLAMVLRDHGAGRVPRYAAHNGAMGGPCMHAGGIVASSQTTASWITDLRGPTVQHWATGTAAPCTSLFKPVSVTEPVDLGPRPSNTMDPATPWWRHERLHRAVMRDPGALLPRYAQERDRIESIWFADPPPSQEAFALADVLESRWLADVVDGRPRDLRPPLVRRQWRRWDRDAGLLRATTASSGAT